MTEKTFTQEEVNQIIRDRLAQEKEKSAAMIREKETEWQAKAEKDRAVMRGELEGLKAEKRHAAVVAALQKASAANPEEMAKLLAPRIKADENGNITMDGPDGKPVPVEKGVNEYMKANPWAVAKKEHQIQGLSAPEGGGVAAPDTALRRAFDI